MKFPKRVKENQSHLDGRSKETKEAVWTTCKECANSMFLHHQQLYELKGQAWLTMCKWEVKTRQWMFAPRLMVSAY